MQTDATWAATRLHLQSLRQEYDAIHQELAAESDWRRREKLGEWAAACLREGVTVVQAWRDQTIAKE